MATPGSPMVMSSNMARPKLPKLILLKGADNTSSFSAYMEHVNGVHGSIMDESEIGAFNPMAKIEPETSKAHGKYIHLRFTHTNKYWGRNNEEDGFLVAVSKQPVEDTSKPSCTLFELSLTDNAGVFQLTHVHSGGLVTIDVATKRYVITKGDSPYTRFSYVDVETICKLPKHVVFKGDDGAYLRGVDLYGRPLLKFMRVAIEDPRCRYEVFPLPSGHVRIKSDFYNKWWRLSPTWICADGGEGGPPYDPATLFWPVRVENDTTALINAGNGCFCKRMTTEHDNHHDCLNAAIDSLTAEARMEIKELVLNRAIKDVQYRLDEARVYDEEPVVTGSSTATNDSDKELQIDVKFEYKHETSYTLGNSLNVKGGVLTSFQGGFLKIVEAKVKVFPTPRFGFTWGSTSTESKTLDASASVYVPPRSSVAVKYVATKGKFSVPFSYRQQETSMTTRKSVMSSRMTDGIYNGTDYYNFHFVVEEPQEL